LLLRLWRRMGVATARDAATAAERVARRLERHDKRVDRLREILERQEKHGAAIAESLGDVRASIARIEQAVAEVGEQARMLTLARKHDATALDAARQLAAELEATAGAIDAHVAGTIEHATVSSDPFPHVAIDRLLPPSLYDRVLEVLPPHAYWRSSGEARDYWEIGADVGPWQTEVIWGFIDRRLVNEMLRPRLLDLFRSHLGSFWRDHFGLDPTCVSYYAAEGRLQRRRKGYRLRPHLDPPHAALTGLLYLARPGDDPMHGTSLYRPATPLPVKRQGIFYPEDHGITLESAVTVPFQANRLLVWMTPLGPHGADLTAHDVPKSIERYTYQFQFVIDKDTRRRLRAK